MAATTPTQIFVLLLVCNNLFHGHLTSAQESCQANAWPPHRPDGNVRFSLLISKNIGNIDQDDPQDCELTSFALQHYLTVEWLVDRLNQANNGSGYIPGITIGFDGLNDCSLPKLAARNSVSVSNNYNPYVGTSSTCTSQDRNSTHAGFVMVSNSNVAKEVASIMSDSSVPIISATATLTELSNRQLYPNFMRTVPSDIHQTTFIADILKTLHWTYIVVAYQDSLYGTLGLTHLQQKAQDKGICIHKSLKLPLNRFDVTNEFNKIINTAKDQSIAVVIIANIQHTKSLLCDLYESSMSRKFNFILTEAVSKYDFEDCMHSSWTFTISTDPDIEFNELKTYINEKYKGEQTKDSTERHPVIAEYLKLDDAPQTGNLVDGSLAPYITSTINAVFALMESVRNLHADICNGQAGLCASMISKMAENGLLELLSHNTINYTQIESGVIPHGLQNVSFTFDEATGEIFHLSNFKQYTVYYFSNQVYTNVGDFSDNSTQLSLSKVMSLSSGPMPTSICAGRCDTCLHNGKIPIVFVPGDVYIVGVLSIHEPDLFDCGAWRKTGNDAFVAEGFIYAVELLKQTTQINFGAIGIDDCYSPLRIMSLLTDYMSDINPSNQDLFPFHVPREDIIGAIGCRSSGCTLATASVFMPQRIPLISYGASSPDLDDRVNYPYFLRTVPSDVFQAQVMVDIIKQMGWEYVGLLYVKNNYGSKGMLAFRNIVDQDGSGICVPKEYAISEENNEESDRDQFFNAWMHFRDLHVKVVVFFGIDERFKSFIEDMERNRRHGKFIFLASEEWGRNRKILNAGTKAARGSITLKLQEVGVESKEPFKRYLKKRQPSSNDTNIWFKEFWQNQFSCNFKGGLINEFDSECEGASLSDEQIDELVNEQRLNHVMNAVFAMGNAFKSIKDNPEKCNGEFPCDYLSSTPEGVVEDIMEQTIGNGEQKRELFDAHGNGAIGFDVFNIQTTDGGQSYDYVQVGTFPGSDELDKNQFKFYDASGNTVSIQASCSEDRCSKCRHRPIPAEPSVAPPENKEQSDSDYKDSDILIISLIIVLLIAIAVIVAAFVLCARRKYKEIEKKMASNDEQLYAQVYPGTYNTATNRLRFSDPNFSPYLDSNQSGGGLSNPAYATDSDNVDSVSQAAMRRQNRSNAKDFGPQISDGSDSTSHRNPIGQPQDATGPVLHYAGRPLPSTAIGRGRADSDSDAAPPRSSNISSVSQPQGFRGPQNDAAHLTGRYVSPSQISLFESPSAQQDPNFNRIMLRMPHSASPEKVTRSNQGEEPVIYYIQDANGQLAALVPNSVTRRSVRSDASSSVVADHGPYSDALAQKKAMLRSQIPETVASSSYPPQALIAMPIQTALAPNTLAQHETVELQDMIQSQPRPHRIHNHAQAVVAETPLSNNSPIHYASPVHNPVSGYGGADAPAYHQSPYQDQATAIPMGDPSVNHFRQISDAYRKQDHFAAIEDPMVPADQLTRNAVGHTNMVDRGRDDDHQHTEPSSAVPDVVSSNPSHSSSQGNHSRNSSDGGKTSEKPKDLGTDVTFFQNSQGQLVQVTVPSTITNV